MKKSEKPVSNIEASEAWERYVQESSGHERNSVKETAAWDRYMAVLRKWRNQQ